VQGDLWSAAATGGAILTFCATVALAFLIGRTRTWAAGWGAGLGLLSAGLYFMLALAIETFCPNMLDAHSVGHYFAILCIAAPIGGSLAACLGYRSWPVIEQLTSNDAMPSICHTWWRWSAADGDRRERRQ